jgi:tetratricopeptide (TPR) repeat protein
MGKSYEQILSQDPSSSVFVELAKALLERGDSTRAMAVCEQGLAFHPKSVVARVLWGKALINLSRPAEAMEQFDRAVAIDRENPHAYNLIGEVLLRKGLYRSALPLLRRAVALQPDDGRVRQWLEQTERALSGGPAPALGDETVLEQAQPPAETQATELHQAFVPAEAPAPSPPAPGEVPAVVIADALLANFRQQTGTIETESPPAAESRSPEGEELAAPESGAPPETTTPEGIPLPEGPAITAPDHRAVEEASAVAPEESDTEQRRPLLSPLESPVAGPPEPMPGLLAHIPVPDLPPPITSLVDMPKVEVSSQAALAIAQEYERELREKLRASEEEAQATFWARHGLKLAVLGVLFVAGGIGGWAYFRTRSNNQNRTVVDELARAHQALNLDTRVGYDEALKTLARALDMDGSSVEAYAMLAYAHALLYEDFGHDPEHQKQAALALTRVGVQEVFPGLTLVAQYYLANDEAQPGERKRVLASGLMDPEVQVLAGKILLAQKDTQGAVERLKRAIDKAPNNVRAWIALASYYRTHDDCKGALEMYQGVPAKVAPDHPERLIGAAECRLVMHSDVETSLHELEKLNPEGLLREQRLRRALALARLLALTGNAQQAVALLTEESKLVPERTFDVSLALSDALRHAGDWEGAQRAAEAALKAHPDSEEAKELLGRVLLGRDRERDLLTRLPEDESRRVHLIRGAALSRLGDWKRARAELQKTQVGGKFPSEAVVYLALADAAEGQPEKAQGVLEKTLAATKRARGEVQVALGRVYWQRGLLDKAQAQFEEAAKDPEDYEGGCSLGRLLLSQAQPEAAEAALMVSVTRNGFHGESRQALARALAMLGRNTEALANLEAWQRDNPLVPVAYRDSAFVLGREGRWREADGASLRAMKLAPKDPEVHRIRASVLFARGDLRGGFASLERASKLNDKDGETFCAIGRAHLRRANSALAEKAFEAAAKLGPSLVCAKVGSLMVHPLTSKVALATLSTLAQKSPQIWDRALAQTVLVRLLLASGAVKDALAAADRAVKLGPFDGESHLVLAMAAMRGKDEDKAKAAFEKAVQFEPGDARVHLAYGDALARSSQDAARAYGEYQLFLRLADHAPEVARVKRVLPNLKKRLATR